MKKSILAVFVFASILVACSDKSGKSEAKEVEKVEAVNAGVNAKLTTLISGSSIDWRASHLGGVQPRFGKISLESVEVLVKEGKITNATMVMNMSSLTVDNFEDEDKKNKLTGHLLSDDFFKVETYPTAKFELTSVVDATGDYNATITGDLTILEVTKSITFKANVTVTETGASVKSEDFVVDRTDWNLTYHVEGSEGVPVDYLISNDIGFTIDVNLAM